MEMSNNAILMPRESGKYISTLAKDVFIEENGVGNIAREIFDNLKSGQISLNNFSESEYHPKDNDPRAADWLMVLDALNFCFWSHQSENKWQVNGQSGYMALAAAIKRAVDRGIPITDPQYYSRITKDELVNIFKEDPGYASIPLLEERLNNLHNVGTVLINKYKGTFMECIRKSQQSAKKLLELIVLDFDCFKDEAEFHGTKVSFYKRAQILVGDLWACYKGKGIAAFSDIDYITMFPDYRVPQVLVHFGALRYSDRLLEILKSDSPLKVGCEEEIEIRGCSIEVIEKVVQEVIIMIQQDNSHSLDKADCNSILVDYYLWDYRRKHQDELECIPYHKIRTIYY